MAHACMLRTQSACLATHAHEHMQHLCMSNPVHLGSESGVSAGCGKGGAQHGLDAFDAEEIAGTASPGFHRIFLGRCHRRIHDELGDSRGVGGCHSDQGRPACYGACRPAGWHADGQSEMAEREQREHLVRTGASCWHDAKTADTVRLMVVRQLVAYALTHTPGLAGGVCPLRFEREARRIGIYITASGEIKRFKGRRRFSARIF